MKIIKTFLKKILPEKVVNIINQKRDAFQIRKSLRWASNNATNMSYFMSSTDKALTKSSEEFSQKLHKSSEHILKDSKIHQGGGGIYGLLYFLVRKIKPETVLETGVASGWSSNAILSALQENNHGHLYSSDLPYLGRKGSLDAIGILVNKVLRRRWTLCVKGDFECLPYFLENIEKIDLFHFDSDKSYMGRSFSWSVVSPILSDSSIVIFDDIQDNFHFRDLVNKLGVEFRVFEFEGKYVGLFCYGGKVSF